MYDGDEKDFSHHLKELNKVPYTGELWTKEFPTLAAYASIINDNAALAITADHIYTKNLSVNCGSDGETGYFYGTVATANAEDISNNYVTATDPGFENYTNKNYSITADTLVGKIAGFTTIDLSVIGRNK